MDSVATYSFISTRYAVQLNHGNKEIETNYRIKLPNHLITIGGIVFPRVLIQFDSSDFYIILKMS